MRKLSSSMGRLLAWTLLVWSAVLVGLELERADHLKTWHAISTLGWWQQLAPASVESAAALGRASHPLLWRALLGVLDVPPAALGACLAVLLLLLAKLGARERRGALGGRLWVTRATGLTLAGLGLAASGSDLYQSGASHSVAEFWALLHAPLAPALLGLEQPAALATVLRWPAWVALLLPGALLLAVSRRAARI